ncbi:MAG: adenylate kinase family protein [Candidatus Aenigmatarchaeota archaeon]
MFHIIAISGVPGTGKTKVAKLLSKRIGAKLIQINELVKKGKVPYTTDTKRNTKEISVSALQKAVAEQINKNKINIIEGHMAHMLDADMIFILRSSPTVLKKRLKMRGWAGSKIKENIDAEILDSVTIESMERHNTDKIFEVDSTSLLPGKTAALINDILKKPSDYRKYGVGTVNWMNKYGRLLIEYKKPHRKLKKKSHKVYKQNKKTHRKQKKR